MTLKIFTCIVTLSDLIGAHLKKEEKKKSHINHNIKNKTTKITCLPKLKPAVSSIITVRVLSQWHDVV